MKLLILLVCIAGAVKSEGDLSFQRFFGKYAAVKMLSSCFGDQFMKEWTKNFTEACRFCNQGAPETYLKDLPLDEYMVDISNTQLNDFPSIDSINEENLMNYIPPVATYPTPSVVNLQSVLSALQGNLTHPILLVPLPYPLLQGVAQTGGYGHFFRQKRQSDEPFFDASTINRVYQKIRAKAGNFSCIMRKVFLFNDKMELNIGNAMHQIDGLAIDLSLKADLFDAITDCVRFATCNPLNKRSLMPAAVQRAITYMRCENKNTLAACVKNDVLKEQEKFDKTALDNIPAGSDVDLGDKMLAIMWGEDGRRRM